jgi:uncharacterized protein Yka (UPF0111/DUF47 family)
MERSPTLEDNQMMTSSYHEISEVEKEADAKSFTSLSTELSDLELSIPSARKLFDKARHWVGDLSLEGVVSQEGQQVTYVTQDLTEKIKLASPIRESAFSNFPVSNSDDLNIVINEIELEAKKLASSVDTLTENLTGILHSLSSMTVDCVFTASDGVTQLCDTADASIKVMYQVMAKCEELNKSVAPVYKIHQQIKDTKRLLDKVEAELSVK